MPIRWQFVGRAEELSEILGGLEHDTGALICGPQGIGKTALAYAVVERLIETGRRVERLFGSGLNLFPLQAFAPLLPVERSGDSTDEGDLLRRIITSVRAEPGAPKTVLVVDDAHSLDPASGEVLLALAGGGIVTVVATVMDIGEAEAAPWLMRLWSGGSCHRLDVGPLGESDVAELLRYALEGDVDPRSVHTLSNIIGGNAFLLRELVLASVKDGVLCRRGDVWLLDGVPSTGRGVVDLIEERLRSLNPDLRSGLELVAVGEPLTLAAAERAVGSERLEELEAERLIVCTETATGTVVSVAHPIWAQVVRDALPRLRLRRLHLDLARALELARLDPVDAVRSARWRLEAGVTSDPRFLLQAASVARTFDLGTAEVLARAAAEREPSVEAVTMLASILTSAGRHEAAAELLDVLPSSDLGENDRELVLFMQSVGTGLLGGDPKAGIALLDESGGSARLRGMKSSLLLLDSTVDEARVLSTAVLDDPDADADARTAAGIGVVGSLFYIGATTELRRRYEAVVRDADHERATDPHGLGRIQVNAFAALAESGALDEAEALARTSFEAGVTGGGEETGWDRSRWAYVLGRIAMLRGDMGGAVRMLRLAVVTPAPFDRPFQRYHASFLARALAGVGQTGPARSVLREVPSDVPRFRLFEPELELAEAAILAAEGNLAEAAERAAWASELAGVSRMCATILVAAHDAARYGGAMLVRNTVTDALPHVDGELLVCRARCVVAMADGDGELLDGVSGEFARMGAMLFATEAAAAASRFHRVSGRGAAAVRSEAKYLGFAVHCTGAVLPWLAGMTSFSPLTRREQEVAILAAAGRRDAEIASELALSARTVQTHLGRAYVKLGIHSRSELATALLPPVSVTSGSQQ